MHSVAKIARKKFGVGAVGPSASPFEVARSEGAGMTEQRLTQRRHVDLLFTSSALCRH
jgi:hypothetical protein